MWGANNGGQLGDGTRATRNTPLQVLDQVATVSYDNDSIIFVGSDGPFTVWGSYSQIQLPQRKDATAISWDAEWRHARVFSDGSLWGRGYDYAHNDNKIYKLMDDVCAAACGSWRILAVQTDGSVWACGFNQYGQVGNGSQGEIDLENFGGNLQQKTHYKLSGITAAIPGSTPLQRSAHQKSTVAQL